MPKGEKWTSSVCPRCTSSIGQALVLIMLSCGVRELCSNGWPITAASQPASQRTSERELESKLSGIALISIAAFKRTSVVLMMLQVEVCLLQVCNNS